MLINNLPTRLLLSNPGFIIPDLILQSSVLRSLTIYKHDFCSPILGSSSFTSSCSNQSCAHQQYTNTTSALQSWVHHILPHPAVICLVLIYNLPTRLLLSNPGFTIPDLILQSSVLCSLTIYQHDFCSPILGSPSLTSSCSHQSCAH